MVDVSQFPMTVRPPRDDDRHQKVLETLKRLRLRREAQRIVRCGRPYPESSEELAEARAERERELAGGDS